MSNSVRLALRVALSGLFWLQFWLEFWLCGWPFWLELWLRCWLLAVLACWRSLAVSDSNFGSNFRVAVGRFGLSFGFVVGCWRFWLDFSFRCWPFLAQILARILASLLVVGRFGLILASLLAVSGSNLGSTFGCVVGRFGLKCILKPTCEIRM